MSQIEKHSGKITEKAGTSSLSPGEVNNEKRKFQLRRKE